MISENKYINFLLHSVPYAGLIFGISIFIYLNFHFGLVVCTAFSLLPFILLIFGFLLNSPYWIMIIIVILNYFVMGLGRYLPVPSIGITMDALFIFAITSLFLKSCYKPVDWKNAKNLFTAVAAIWLTYCVAEVTNPLSVSTRAWATSVRLMSLYLFLIAILVPVVFSKYKNLKSFISIWSILTVLAVLKALYQKVFGFDSAELYWLYVEGKAKTHILSTGIRYFSFFTDAANFGSGMGLSMVVFSIIGINEKKLIWKIYYILVGLLAGYGMMIAGTRSSMIIPFAGFTLYLILSKNIKVIISGGVLLIFIFYFFGFTKIGQGNAEIRRMRSAFNFEQDASFKIRMENQEKIRTYMADKPFGVGIGLGGGKALTNAPTLFTAQIPTDSWFVVLWEETGIVGLVLYLSLFLFLIVKGGLMAMFLVKNHQLKFLMIALVSGTFGILVSSYSNEVVAQFPNGILIYMSLAFVFMGKKFDAEIEGAGPKVAEHGK